MTSTVTTSLMFTDLVGSTELASGLPPAAAEALRTTHFGLLREAVQRTGGSEVKNLGDGLMVAYPSVGAALDGAVAVQQVIERHNRRAVNALSVRVGVSTGDVTEENGDYFGEAVIEAARLCARAEGGQILTTDLVSMQARRSDHQFASLGTIELKGLPAPLAVFEVRWTPAQRSGDVPLPHRLSLTPAPGIVGRTVERAHMYEAWKAAVSGDGRRVVLLAGEPGIGKTTLCCDLAQRAHQEGATVLYGRCDENLGLPYQPFVEALSEYLAEASGAALDALTERQIGELARLVPELRARAPEVTAPPSTDGDADRYLLFGAVSDAIGAMGSRAPVVLVLDDLHWADQSTVLLLRHLVATLQRLEVLILVAYRDSDLSATHPMTECLAELWREPGVDRVPVIGLDDNEVVTLLESLAGHEMVEEGIELAHAVRRDTDGNPFFTFEVLRHLAETGAIRLEGTRWVASADLASIGLPGSVRDVIGQRVRRLGDNTHDVLTAAAVIGRDFDVSLLAGITKRDEDEILEVLEHATSAQIVREVVGLSERFTFSHALFQHALYDELSASRRARMHYRIGELIESDCGNDPGERIGELAHHWASATRPAEAAKAIEYTRRAGDRALATFAPSEALRYYRKALELLESAPEPNSSERLRALVGLGDAQRRLADQSFRATLLQAADEAARAGDVDRLVAAALANQRLEGGTVTGIVDHEQIAVLEQALAAVGAGDDRARAALLATLAGQLAFARDHDRQMELALAAESIARRIDDSATLVRVFNLTTTALWLPQNVEHYARLSRESTELAERSGDPLAMMYAALRRVHVATSAVDGPAIAVAIADFARLARQVGMPFTLWSSTQTRCWHTLLRGDADEAERLAQEVLALGSETAQPDAVAAFGATLANVRWHQGRTDEMLPILAQAVVDNPRLPAFQAAYAVMLCENGQLEPARELLVRAAGEDFYATAVDHTWLTGTALWGDVAAVVGDTDAAAVLYERLAPFEMQSVASLVTFAGTVRMYLARLAATLGRTEAFEHFERADAQLRALEAPFFHARNQVEWARHLASTGDDRDRGRARELLSEAIATARAYGCAGVERRAAGLISDLS